MAAVASAVCIAQAAVLVRGFPPVHPVTMNAVGMGTAAALLLVGSMMAGEPHVLPQQVATWAAVGYLVVVGSVVVFVLYLVGLRYWATSQAAYGFVFVPFATVMLSAWLANEPLGIGLLLGRLLVLSGVYVRALRPMGPGSTPGGISPRR